VGHGLEGPDHYLPSRGKSILIHPFLRGLLHATTVMGVNQLVTNNSLEEEPSLRV
jgi:hypothetical protein